MVVYLPLAYRPLAPLLTLCRNSLNNFNEKEDYSSSKLLLKKLRMSLSIDRLKATVSRHMHKKNTNLPQIETCFLFAQ